MEAVCNRTLFLISTGVLLTLVLFPMVSGSGGHIEIDERTETKLQVDLEDGCNMQFLGFSRGLSFNSSMIMRVQAPSDPIIRGTRYNISGRLLIDRGTIGSIDEEDLPARGDWLDLYWMDGSEYYELKHIRTDENGRWNTTFPVEAPYWTEDTRLRIRFKGEWNDGSGQKNLSHRDHSVLSRQELWKDDDGDGLVDEEKLNFLDDDDDGLFDEDVNGWITKDPIMKDVSFEIRHLPILEFNISREVVILDEDQGIEITCSLSDPTQPFGIIGVKRLQITLDDEIIYEGDAVSGSSCRHSMLKTVITLDDDTKAGAHDLKVILDPDTDPGNNTGYVRTEVSRKIMVRRPLKVMFDDIDPERGTLRAYRGETFWINGTIFDYLEYEKTGTIVPPWTQIDPVSDHQFRLKLRFGEPIDPYSFNTTDYQYDTATGKFYFELSPNRGTTPLGYHRCSLEIHPKNRSSRDQIFEISTHSLTCDMRARTRIRIWLDQNKNGIDDAYENSRDPLDHPIIRYPDHPSKYNYDWRFFRIRGMVMDLSQSSGAIKVGVPACELNFSYGHGMEWERNIPLITDDHGNFEIDAPILVGHGCGPVPIFVEMVDAGGFYDLSTYIDTDGDPFSNVWGTRIIMEEPNGTLGEWMQIRGRLLDERGVRIEGAHVGIYGNRLYYMDPSDEVPVQTDHMLLGYAVSGAFGQLSFDIYLDPNMIGVPQFFARYQGSQEWPDGENGPRYHPGDAFYGCESEKVGARIHTKVNFTDIESLEYLVRNGEAAIRGRMVQSTEWGPTDRGIDGVRVWAELIQDGKGVFFGEDVTSYEDERSGFFRIKTLSVPSDLHVGPVEIILHVENDTYEKGQRVVVPTSTSNYSYVWSSTRIKEKYFGPMDHDIMPVCYYDFIQGQPEHWNFTYQVLEGSTEVTSGGPVVGGIVWLNITMDNFKNCTKAITDWNGTVRFNFTSDFTDSRTGEPFVIPKGSHQSNLTLQINFIGMKGYTNSIKTRYSTIRRPQDPPERTFIERIGDLILPDIGLKLLLFIAFGISTCIILCSIAGIRAEIRRRKKVKMISTMKFIRIEQ